MLSLAAGSAEYFGQIDESLLMQDLVVRVNVGMGSTNPQQRLERFMLPLNASANLPEFTAELDFVEIGKEMWALAGQGDGSRFMLTPEKKQERAEQQSQQQDPRVQVEQMRGELQQALAQFKEEQATAREQMKIQSKERLEAAKFQDNERDRQLKMQIAQYEGEMDQVLAEMRYVGEKDKQFDALKVRLNETVMKLSQTRELVNMKASADNLPKPPVEPPGEAPDGYSSQR